MEILTRLAIAVAIILGGILLYWAISKLRLSVLGRRAQSGSHLGGLELRPGVPAILYFTTPDCAPCRTVQGPAIEELGEQLGDRLQVVKIDASEQMALADYWGVLSVPTTFIIDAEGQPRHVNNGVTPAVRLRQQLREFAGLADMPEDKPRLGVPEKRQAFRAERG
jgi:thioredoxin-like negative regulator of GroEL